MSAVKGRIQLTSFAVGDVSGKKTESTEHYKMFQKFIDILTIIGIPLGMELRFNFIEYLHAQHILLLLLSLLNVSDTTGIQNDTKCFIYSQWSSVLPLY